MAACPRVTDQIWRPMPLEIERKFLLLNDSWRMLVRDSETLRDGLLAASPSGKLRVRIYRDRATLALKSAPHGLVRSEYEYAIPTADAEDMLAKHCENNVLEKVRHYIDFQGFTWEVDEYRGLLSGVIIAEVELKSADDEVPLPPWVGAEITGDPAYNKINMMSARRRASIDPATT
jgi:adenylate cyclase